MTATVQENSNVGEKELVACVPHLRAFAWFLARNRDLADDLVQDTIVRALAAAHQFRSWTNLKAWMFTILRNLHYSEVRKSRVQIQSLDDPLVYEPTVPPSQVASLEFGDFRRAFWQLADGQREALIPIGASGLSYEEAAKICDWPKGTIKSRVSRARRELLRGSSRMVWWLTSDGTHPRWPATSAVRWTAGAQRHQRHEPNMTGVSRRLFGS